MRKLFLLDGMALAYRAHFALIRSPIFNSKGMNTSAAYGFTATLIDLIQKQQPTHLAIAFVAFSLVRFLSYRVKLQYKKLSPQVIRNALLHIQQSILRDKRTRERYCLPSNSTLEAEKIYQAMGLKLNRTPLKLPS